MGKKGKRLNFQMKPLTTKQKAIVLPAMVVVGGIAVAGAIFAIILMPIIDDGSKRGVAANGFSAFVEENTDLGAGKLVTKGDVVSALGKKAKSVSNVSVSKVFNYNGDRSQTATFSFVRADGKYASLYIDMTEFKSQDSMNAESIFTKTALARVINGHSTYYMHAQTIGSVREYRLLAVNGLKAYKFVIDQPVNNIAINEVASVASLITLAQKAKL